MGDPRKFKNKYSGPAHPWQRVRLEEERVLVNEYGLKTKRELWKVSSKLKAFASQAKRLTALRSEQSTKESTQLIDRLAKLGLLGAGSTLDDVLGLNVRNLLDRRLQTVVRKKGLARTPVQARQYIVHGHVLVGARKVCAPSYLVPVSDEGQVSFVGNSTLANPEHPERVIKPKAKSSARPERRPPRREGRR